MFSPMLSGGAAIGNITMCEDDKYHLLLKPQPAQIKVFGERHTGTRAVIRMLYDHSRQRQGFTGAGQGGQKRRWKKGFDKELYKDAIEDIRRRNYGGVSAWKHAAPMIDGSYAAQKRAVLFLVRDPYSWMVSFHRKPYHARAPVPQMSAFLQQPWPSVQRDNVAAVLPSPMALWTEKLRAYRAFLQAKPVPAGVLHFEDFVLDPVAALGAAMADLGVDPKGLRTLARPTKSWGLSEVERVVHYKSEAWRASLSPAAASQITDLVDWEVAAYFGYSRREQQEFS